MGCFLACFGISNKKRKRRKHSHKVLVAAQIKGSYEPLDSSSILNLGKAENPKNADSEPREKSKEQQKLKPKKKVSFNLNVQTYEPISNTYHLLEDEEEVKMGNSGERKQGGLLPGTDSTSYSNYRYQNCRDYYEEEDDITFEDSDLEDDEDEYEDDYDWESDIDDSQRICSKNGISADQVEVDAIAKLGMPLSVRDVHSVLSPVENLSQWRAAKAKSAPQKKNQRKENIGFFQETPSMMPFRSNSNFGSSPLCNQSKPLLREIKVDASFSSWINSPKTHQSKLETSNSWEIRRDRPVFEPTFLKAC